MQPPAPPDQLCPAAPGRCSLPLPMLSWWRARRRAGAACRQQRLGGCRSGIAADLGASRGGVDHGWEPGRCNVCKVCPLQPRASELATDAGLCNWIRGAKRGKCRDGREAVGQHGQLRPRGALRGPAGQNPSVHSCGISRQAAIGATNQRVGHPRHFCRTGPVYFVAAGPRSIACLTKSTVVAAGADLPAIAALPEGCGLRRGLSSSAGIHGEVLDPCDADGAVAHGAGAAGAAAAAAGAAGSFTMTATAQRGREPSKQRIPPTTATTAASRCASPPPSAAPGRSATRQVSTVPLRHLFW